MRLIGITNIGDRKKPWRVRFVDSKGVARSLHFPAEVDAREYARVTFSATQTEISEGEKTLLLALRNWAQAEGVDLNSAAVRFMAEAKAKLTPTVSIGTAYDQYKTDMVQRNLRPAYRTHAEYVLDRWTRDRESWPVSGIRPEDVILYIGGQAGGQDHKATVRNRICTFLRWCNERGWSKIDTRTIRFREGRSDRRRIGCYTPEQTKAFLQATPEKLRPVMALLFFTGIRPKGEVSRLNWKDIDPKRKVIEIHEDVSKVRTHRILYNIPDNFWVWHKTYRPKGPVLPVTYRNFRAAVAKICAALKCDWPHDCTRHTFATYAYHRGAEWTMDMLGHADYDLLVKRYKHHATPEMAAAYWSIVP
jgi:integrase